MLISVQILAKILCIHCENPELYFEQEGLKIIKASDLRGNGISHFFLNKLEVIRYLHDNPSKLQLIMTYEPENAYEQVIINELFGKDIP